MSSPDVVRFADPYKRCTTCLGWVTGYRPAPSGPDVLTPCWHANYEDLCPSWSPVDGCNCVATLGRREHPVPSGPFPAGVVL